MRAPKRRKGGKPVAIVRSGSVALPVYQCRDGSSTRFILSYHRAGKRVRQSFTSLEKAKREALLVAHRIQSGMQHVTDMTPADRDAYAAARKLLDASGTGVPLVAAAEDYLRARATAGIEQWLGELRISPSTRNSMLRHANMLFAFALAHDYLPEGRAAAPSGVGKARVVGGDVSLFTPEQMRAILHAAPPHLVPILAIGAFSGIRMADLARLDWSAVNLDRRIIEVRAGQAKTASRRVIPIPDNLRAWLAPLPRRGKVVPHQSLQREVTALAKSLGIAWPGNVLRHSFISCRIAIVKSADQVALEAGNSAAIIFRHYRELTTEPVAAEWFSILPKEGQWENGNGYAFDRASRTVTLGGAPE